MSLRCLVLIGLLSSVASARPAVQVVVDASEGASRTLSGTLAQVKAATTRIRPIDLSVRLAGGGSGDEACRATRTVVPAGVSAGPVLDALKVEAQGALPLVAALEGAAGDLPRRPGLVRGLALVTNGGDGCGRDLCDAVAELRRQPGLGQVLVLFTGRDPKAARRLECLGRVVRVTEKEVAHRLDAFLDGLAQPSTLRVTAKDVDDAAPVTVEVFAAGDEVPAATGKGGQALTLAAGRWDVRVVDATVETAPREGWRRDVELAAGSKVNLAVAMSTEPARLVVDVRLNGRPAPGGTRLFVHKPGLVEEEVASGWPGEAFAVPPGRWDVRAEIPGGAAGMIVVWQPEVRVVAGQRIKLRLDAAHKLGFLHVDVVSGDVVLIDAAATLHEGDRRSGDGVSLVVGQADPTPVGRYTVGVEWHSAGGTVRKWVGDVVVESEKITKKVIDVGPTGNLSVDLQGFSNDTDAVIHLVRPRQLEPVGTLAPFEPFRVPAGRYDVRVLQTWPLPGLWWRRDVEIKAGDEKMLIINAK